MSIKLEIGKKYVCRNGAVVGPLDYDKGNPQYPFCCDVPPDLFQGQVHSLWKPDGRWNIFESDHEFDIVAEYHEYVWKWMVPDKPGVWALGGSDKDCPREFSVEFIKSTLACNWCWCCFLMILPSIQMPPKQRVTKRLWLRKTDFKAGTAYLPEGERARFSVVASEIFGYEERWATKDIVPEGWISTSVMKEFEE